MNVLLISTFLCGNGVRVFNNNNRRNNNIKIAVFRRKFYTQNKLTRHKKQIVLQKYLKNANVIFIDDKNKFLQL